MQSWPTISIPPLGISLPPLKLETTSGKFGERGEIFTSYVCGITPYDATHLGHAATYLSFDLIHRFQVLRGQTLKFVENITDIDDPLFERANRDGQDWKELSTNQIDLFKQDMTALRVLPPQSYVAVTEIIDKVMDAISIIGEKGFTYIVGVDTYFDLSSFIKDLPLSYDKALSIFSERGGDPKREGKRDPLDPLLWQSNKPGEPGWDSPMGFGRPGWHIECSVIALSYLLGTNYLANSSLPNPLIDLQGGGSDLIFPHHFMSASLAKALTGNEFATSYVHTGMIGLDGEKMSKSKGNLVFVSKLLSQGIDPMLIRYALLNGNYSQDRMWTNAILQESEIFIGRVRSALARNEVAPTSQTVMQMVNAISDNLNTVLAFNHLEAWVDQTEAGIEGGSVGEISRLLDSLLGLAL